MSKINVSNLTFCYEGSFDNIFENVSFYIDTDWKLGFIGRNGKGKTTFLNLLLGKYEYRGNISTSTVFEYFPYKISNHMLELNASDFLSELKPDCEEWRVICELNKLDTSAELLYKPFKNLSHGERTKVFLATLFSGENDFLLIDEPTNHLDIESRDIVKKYLSNKKGFILVSHDRDLLDACIDHVLVLNRKSIEVQSGNFSSWWENKMRHDNYSRTENEKHLKEISSLKKSVQRCQNWADKNENTKIGYNPIKEHDRSAGSRPYIASKTKKMQSRVKQYERRIENEIMEKEGLLNDIENPADLKIYPLQFQKSHFNSSDSSNAKTLISAKNLALSYNENKTVLSDFNFKLNQGERIFLHGKNGCGKSSFVKAIINKNNKYDNGQPAICGGALSIPSGIKISYINQDTSFLHGNVKQFCSERGLDESLFFALLRQLDMERVQFEKKLEDFSEGQKKKVLIAASLMTPAHIYIWDEPLNYIDVFSRMQIEELLLKYQPTMLLIEHDVMFQKKIATDVIEIPIYRNPL